MSDFIEKPHSIRTNATLGPTEAIPDSVRVLASTIGPTKTGRDVMVAFGTVGDPRFPSGYGFFDMMLTWKQAEDLHKELGEVLARPRTPVS